MKGEEKCLKVEVWKPERHKLGDSDMRKNNIKMDLNVM